MCGVTRSRHGDCSIVAKRVQRPPAGLPVRRSVMARLIHTSDVHLGAPLSWLGEMASEQREQLKSTLSAIIDLAMAEAVDCLVIAGDLFDSQSPPASDVRFAFQEFERLAAGGGATVVILPGSHDHLVAASVYASYRKEFERIGRVAVLGLDGRPSVEVDACGLSVKGAPPRSNRSSEHQLAGLVPNPAYPFNVAVAHGSLTSAPVAADDHPISQDEFSGWSYVALGHWHSWRDVSHGGIKAIYPGAPETIATDQFGSGNVALVDLSADGAAVEKVRVGRRSLSAVDVDVTGLAGTRAVVERVRSQLPPSENAIVVLALSGLLSVDSGLDVEELRETLAGDYFHVALGSRDYQVRMEDGELEALPERLVIGRFARLMRERYRDATTNDERQAIEDALQLGVALLQGKGVLG